MKIEIDALRALAAQHQVPTDVVTTAVIDALNTAYAAREDAIDGARITVTDTGDVQLTLQNGDVTTPGSFGRIAATTARGAVIAWVRDQQRRKAVGPWADREGRTFDAIVRGSGRNNELRLTIDGVTAVLPAGEQTPGEAPAAGDTLTVLLLAANVDGNDNIKLTVSRRQPALVTALIEANCPELRNGTVTVASIAREPGIRTKISLAADDGMDPVAAVVGAGGHRLRPVVTAINGERIDLVRHSDDPAQLAAAALTPARTAGAETTDPARRQVRVYVPVDQLALATGADGINVRLAQRLTRTKIQIVPVD